MEKTRHLLCRRDYDGIVDKDSTYRSLPDRTSCRIQICKEWIDLIMGKSAPKNVYLIYSETKFDGAKKVILFRGEFNEWKHKTVGWKNRDKTTYMGHTFDEMFGSETKVTLWVKVTQAPPPPAKKAAKK